MMTEICAYLNNYFDRGQKRFFGTFHVENGALVEGESMGLQAGQYYRIIGSPLNEGVWEYGTDVLRDENPFDGAVWLMAVPPAVVSLAKDIAAWQDKYGGVNSVNMSPYNSESFGGYSYSKSGGGASSGDSGSGDWMSAFRSRLSRWRKL